jgi:hypothetical protein
LFSHVVTNSWLVTATTAGDGIFFSRNTRTFSYSNRWIPKDYRENKTKKTYITFFSFSL